MIYLYVLYERKFYTMRQKVRKTLIFISFLLFPVTMWYFSPYLIIQGMSEHILNGSFFVFVSMLVLSVFFGRIWCGWLCPAGGLQECAAATNDKPAKGGWRNGIKYGIWTVWIAAVIATYIMAKGDVKADFFYMTDHGISIADISNYIIYYGVLFILVLPSMIHGRRAACHYICWMAPFMQIGSAIGRLLHIPQPHIESDKEKCVSCGKCNTVCPMGLDVREMVSSGKNARCAECIQCGACVDACPKDVLRVQLTWKKKEKKEKVDG